MDNWEKEANELHIKLCGECCHDVTFEAKLRKALRDVRKRTIEECAKVAEKYEPSEKSDHVAYASREIRGLEK